ncbi:hypothetical protein [Enterococcus casseliflavus]|uniref:hypothetical protein n=1 Tax=Enterococcus casseliflavus TaxID=37734 RepID=UPI0011A894E1|nr:hypothetical protein [Enterococcus casseliflavus]
MTKFWMIIKAFLISITTAFLVTNSENYIYSFLNSMGAENEVFQKSVLSAVITLAFGVVSWLIELIAESMFLLFAKIKIEITIKQNNKKRSNIVFSPNNLGFYEKQTLELEVKMHPKGKFSNFIAKHLDINLEVFFNPELIDVELAEQWGNQSLNGYIIAKRAIKVHILKKMNTKGEQFRSTEYKMVEKILFQPISVMEAETHLDYIPTLGKGNMITNKFAKNFVEVKYNPFRIICEEGAK